MRSFATRKNSLLFALLCVLCLFQTPSRVQEENPREQYLRAIKGEPPVSRRGPGKAPRSRKPPDPNAPPFQSESPAFSLSNR